jgi:hypothetical protein
MLWRHLPSVAHTLIDRVIHPSVLWPGPGHPETMKMEPPPRLFSHQCLEEEFSEVAPSSLPSLQ